MILGLWNINLISNGINCLVKYQVNKSVHQIVNIFNKQYNKLNYGVQEGYLKYLGYARMAG